MKKIIDYFKNIDKNYYLIICFCLLMVIIVVPKGYVFGSRIDWVSQHVMFPDYFRKLFYETHKLVPSLGISLGAGQNIFNFSYYGLLSPYVLLSYLFPFISMPVFIIILNIIIYIVIGLLLYYFFKEEYAKNISFFTTIVLLCAGPILFHLHRHFMFINYFPFLILGLIAIRNYFKSGALRYLALTTFMMIMTSYYYSIGGILVFVTYGIYYYLKTKKFEVKDFLKTGFKLMIPIIIAILMSAVLLIPTLYVIINGRSSGKELELLNLLIPKLDMQYLLYFHYSLGLTALTVVAMIYSFLTKKRENIFLVVTMILLLTIPLIVYLLNGKLYFRPKVLIPFLPLFGLFILEFMKNLIYDKINIKNISIITLFISSIILLLGYYNLAFYIDILGVIVIIGLFSKYKNKTILLLLLITPFLTMYLDNKAEEFLSKKELNYLLNIKRDNKIVNILNQEEDMVRFNNLTETLHTVNKIVQVDYNQNSIYSSTYNKYYNKFYIKVFKNPLTYRNKLVMSQSNNVMYQMFMGVKYVYGNKAGIGYTKVTKNIYKNPDVLPMFYGSSNLISKDDFNNIEYPYNTEALLNNVVVNEANSNKSTTNIRKMDFNYDIQTEKNVGVVKTDNYIEIAAKNNKAEIVLTPKEDIKNDIFFVTFDIANKKTCKEGDSRITINDVTNVVTCEDWRYKNNNYIFHYVLSNDVNNNKIVLKFDKGIYVIKDINIYKLPYNSIKNIRKSISLFKLDTAKTTSDYIKGSINMKDDGYFVTSIPFDKGFNCYVDGKLIKKEKVNTAFLGFKLMKGNHEVVIEYKSPWLNYGEIISVLGVILFALLIFLERRKARLSNLLNA